MSRQCPINLPVWEEGRKQIQKYTRVGPGLVRMEKKRFFDPSLGFASAWLRFCSAWLGLGFGPVRVRLGSAPVLFGFASARLRFCSDSLGPGFGSVRVRFCSASVLFGFACARLRFCSGSLPFGSVFFRVRFGRLRN